MFVHFWLEKVLPPSVQSKNKARELGMMDEREA
jgi:hypothetical protein